MFDDNIHPIFKFNIDDAIQAGVLSPYKEKKITSHNL